MSFKIVKNPRAWWPVTFAGVTEEGEVIENGFEMRFRILDEDTQAGLEAELRALDREQDGADLTPSALSAALVLKLAEDWRGVLVDDGSEAGASLPFTPANVATLMRVPNVFLGVCGAYRACRAGGAGAREGN